MAFELKRHLQECVRVLKITRKPSRLEFSAAAKVTGIGILLIGLIGLVIFLVNAYTGIFSGV